MKLNLRRRAVVAALLGATCTLALPPLDQWWVLFICVPLALVGLESLLNEKAVRIALVGWCFGFGYFIAALHWIAYAFFVDAANDLWMMPVAVGGLAAFLALVWALAAMLAALLARRGHPLWLAVPVAFAAIEWLRGHIFTGFPWAVFGQMADGMGGTIQAAAFVGMTGLTFLVWLWASATYGIWKDRGALRAIAVMLVLSFPVLWLLGEWRLANHPTEYAANIMLRLVQPNISQNDKWRQGNARKIFDQLLALTSAPPSTGKPVTHIIWPESSIPFLIDESDKGRAELAKALQPGQILLAGAVRRAAPRDDANYFTSVLIIDSNANVLNHYDKWHLVPGGEFLPLAWALEPLGLRRLVSLPESFTPGAGPTTLPVPQAGNAGFSVCYEAIFPGAVASATSHPDWLVNVTNDGWFSGSVGPYQHLAQMRLRSVEIGAPAARAANTGISAVIDAFGRETFRSQPDTASSYDIALPQTGPNTLYSQWADMVFFGLLSLGIVLGEVAKRRYTPRPNQSGAGV